MKNGGDGVITIPQFLYSALEEVSGESHAPSALHLEKKSSLICWTGGSGGGATVPVWRL